MKKIKLEFYESKKEFEKMLKGTHTVTVDDNARVIIPKIFRDIIHKTNTSKKYYIISDNMNKEPYAAIIPANLIDERRISTKSFGSYQTAVARKNNDISLPQIFSKENISESYTGKLQMQGFINILFVHPKDVDIYDFIEFNYLNQKKK